MPVICSVFILHYSMKNYRKFFRYTLLLLWLTGIRIYAYGQQSDTLRVSLGDLEQTFLSRNYQLLAQRYQIDISSAGITQAGLRPNPNLWFQTNLYNPNTGKILPMTTPSRADLDNQVYNSGYFAIQLQQMILLAGKRSKLIALAESNRNLTQLAFRDLLRSLRYQLYTTYANLYFDLQALRLFQDELGRQQRLTESYRIALQTGGVAPYEVTRLEASTRDLQANISNYQAQIADEQAILRVLLRQGTPHPFYLPTSLEIQPTAPPALAAALDSALSNRPDAALAQEQITNAQRSLALERARRVPDLTTGMLYERYGNAYTNFLGLQLTMDLPIANRNQGAIKAAEMGLKNVQAGLDNQQTIVQSEVLNAYDKLNAYYNQLSSRPAGYLDRIQNISVEATKSYNNRVIGLLDYLDKIRTYQQAKLNHIGLENNIFQTQQLVNYVTNTHFF